MAKTSKKLDNLRAEYSQQARALVARTADIEPKCIKVNLNMALLYFLFFLQNFGTSANIICIWQKPSREKYVTHHYLICLMRLMNAVQTIHYTRCISLKRVTSSRDPS